MNPSETTRKKTELTNRRQKVAEMYLSGQYMSAIAQSLGVDTATISRDLTELRKEWLDRSINHIDQKKAIELAKLDRLEVTYWEAWERSRLDAEIHIEKSSTRGHTTIDEKRGQSGNAAFLEGVLKCIQQRCKILGIEAPTKIAPTDPTGQQPYNGGISDEERAARIAAILSQVQQRQTNG